jgi:hypothetical protein
MEQRIDAASEVADDNRKACIKSCIENCPGFDWRWRIVQAADTPKKQKACSKLETWCEKQLEEEWRAQSEANSLAADPYKFYGVRRSDF